MLAWFSNKCTYTKFTPAIFVTKIRKSPDVAETDGVTKTTEQKVETSSPVATGLVFVLAEVLAQVFHIFVLFRPGTRAGR